MPIIHKYEECAPVLHTVHVINVRVTNTVCLVLKGLKNFKFVLMLLFRFVIYRRQLLLDFLDRCIEINGISTNERYVFFGMVRKMRMVADCIESFETRK